MEAAVGSYSGSVRDVTSLGELETLTSDTLRWLGFGAFIMAPSDLGTEVERFGPHNREYLAAYQAERFYLIDPVVQHLHTSWLPVVWDYRDHVRCADQRCVELFQRSREVGYQCGVSMSINGPLGHQYALTCIFDGAPDVLQNRHRELSHDVLIIASYLAQTYHHLTGHDENDPVTLTPRERECLLWTSKGKTAWEISSILGVAERTVNFHLQNAMTKLETSSKHHAWLKAFRLGIL
jgi:DNA-binding CsgD family transcriptional regulator